MYEQVIFYNHYGNGDIFESREFIKEWRDLVPAKHYLYAHGKPKKILKDLEWLEFKEITVHMDSMRGVWDDLNGNLYVNTWIGRDGKYVLPGIGCTVEKLLEMHNDMLKVYGFGRLIKSPKEYIPSVDYSKFDIDNANIFIKVHLGEPLVFIDNGMVQSSQAKNFDFNPIIKSVAEIKKDTQFITTQQVSFALPNVHPASSILKLNEFDLYEISYLSTFCDVLIGRNSGPHVFTQTKENCADLKKLLSFTYTYSGSSFVVNTPVTIQKHWSDATDYKGVLDKILEVLG